VSSSFQQPQAPPIEHPHEPQQTSVPLQVPEGWQRPPEQVPEVEHGLDGLQPPVAYG
jgi:hypothetical protein